MGWNIRLDRLSNPLSSSEILQNFVKFGEILKSRNLVITYFAKLVKIFIHGHPTLLPIVLSSLKLTLTNIRSGFFSVKRHVYLYEDAYRL